jgi:diketogulonate reductase-like aldo/keto reductase
MTPIADRARRYDPSRRLLRHVRHGRRLRDAVVNALKAGYRHIDTA